GHKSQGGSTITMQVARNFFLTRKKLYIRKIREIFLAQRIERELSKEDILRLYLNKIYLGNHAYGVGAAAELYYGKTVWQLSLAQMAMIAGLPKAPSSFNPLADPQRATERRGYVLGRMHDLGYINQTAYARAMAAPVTARPHGPQVTIAAPYVAEMARDYMTGQYGDSAYTAGFQVVTTIDSRLQQAAEHALTGNLERFDRNQGWRGALAHTTLPASASATTLAAAVATVPAVANLVPGVVSAISKQSVSVYLQGHGLTRIDWSGLQWAAGKSDTAGSFLKRGDLIYAIADGTQWQLGQLPQVQGAMVALDPYDGAIVALDGGFAFNQSKFNRAIQAHRGLGSSFKPFVYSAALEKGMTPATLISNAPFVSVANRALSDLWRPQNYERNTSGLMRLREGLVHSINIVSVRILQRIGVVPAIDWAEHFGFTSAELPHNLTLVLGSASLTPLSMARGYAVFANGGFLVRPYFIQRVTGPGGNLLAVANPWVACASCTAANAASAAAPVTAAVPASAAVAATAPSAPVSVAAPASAVAAATSAATRAHKAKVLVAQPSNVPRLAPRTIPAQNAYLMTSMLHSVIERGTGHDARILGRDDLAGKTGTTNDYSNAWFDGFGPRLVAVAWVGYDQPHSLGHGETGARAALPMWINFMGAALKGVPEAPATMPPGLVTVRIDSKTGLRCNADDPNAMWETFRTGNVPPRNQTQQAPSLYGGGGSSANGDP
ncbi:MAG: penicillin-binding protein 1A, partial [Gammaproteobacteria bacterium]